MVTTLGDEEDSRFHAIYQTMLLRDPSRSVSRPLIAQRFGFADTNEGVFLNVCNQLFDADQGATIMLAPKLAVLLRLGGPANFQFRPLGACAGQSPRRSHYVRRAIAEHWTAYR